MSYAPQSLSLLFFFNHPATTEIYTLSLHDALPISAAFCARSAYRQNRRAARNRSGRAASQDARAGRSEEHTSELQSLRHLVCRLLLEKKKEANSDQAFAFNNIDGLRRPHDHTVLPF